jgi:hypothetical protein
MFGLNIKIFKYCQQQCFNFLAMLHTVLNFFLKYCRHCLKFCSAVTNSVKQIYHKQLTFDILYWSLYSDRDVLLSELIIVYQTYSYSPIKSFQMFHGKY